MRKKVHVLILTLILALFAGSMAVQAENLSSISATTATVNVGDDGFKLEMINLKEGEKPRWISYNENVARVDQDGNVTPVRKGTAIISSGIGFPRETCKVTVVEPDIKLDKTEATLYRSDHDPTPGDAVTLTAKINGAVKDVAKIEWKSSDESVAKVTKDSNGKCVVKAVNGTDGKAGEAVITAEANGKKASCKVYVIDSSISLNAKTIQLSEGSSVKLLPTVVGEKKNITWTSDKPNVATVSGGTITGKKDSEETVTVTATANGVSATCTVTVVKKQISINEKNVLLFVNGKDGAEGETKELKTNAKKTDNVIWTSSDNSKIKIKANSKDKSKATITAVGSGTAVITAKIEKSEGITETDTCVVEVKNIKEVITKESVQLKTNGIDKTCRIKHTMDGRRKAVWKSSKPAVVSVKDGVLTAKKAGSATVSVESNGYKDELDVVVVDTKNSISIALNHYEYTLYKIKSGENSKAKVKENGNTVALKALINGKGRNAKWRSSNAKVAEVDKKGNVTAKSAGLACITAETDGLTAKCWISVKNPEIILDKTEFVIRQGEKVNLWKDASMAITGATQSVKYTSSDKKKVAVDSKGVVTGKNLGQATITINANGAEAVCNVTVSACGDEHQLSAKTTVRPASCEKSGLDEQTCSVCEGKIQTITPPLGHDFKEWTVYKDTTVYAVGLEKRVCKRDGCGAEETRIIPLKEKDDFKKDDFEKDDFDEDGFVTVDGYKLMWHDEFNGTKLDRDSWNVELHEPGWVNKELQEYVDSGRNIYVEGGNLVIQALERKDKYGRPIYTERNKKQMKTYTSGRINTKDQLDYKYGRFEARAKVPSGKGFLPAFWMMPTNENYYGQWPKCGEIDIMEVLGSNTKTAHSTLHFGDPHTQQQGTFTLSGGDFSEEFHVYACEWEPGEMRFYVDGILFYKVNDWFTQTTGFEKKTYPAPYDQPFYMILNLAVGGEWVGYPDEDAKMGDNAQLVVDYVRVYQKDAAVYEEMEKNVKVPVTDVVLRDPDEDGNYIINGDFAKNESLPNGENWKLLLAEKGKASATISNKALHITTTEEGIENYSVQIVQADLPVEKGCRYELSYDAYADQARTMVTALTAPDRGYERYLKNTIVNLTTTNQTFTHEFDMEAESDANGRLEFNLGNQDSTAKVHISNVKLKKLEGGAQESDRLPDGNYVHNGSFDVGNEPGKLRLKYWNLDTTNCSEAKISVTNDAKREMKVEVPDTVANLEAVKVSQNVAIEGGKDNKGKDRVYTLSFDARADQAKTIKSTIAGETFDAQLTTESTTYKYEFTPAQDVKGSELQFLLGAQGTTYIDNVCVRENILIVNGDFSSGMSGFEVYVSDDAKVPDYTVDSLSDGDNPNPAFSIDITDTADAGWKIQLKQNNIKLEKDKWYKFSFDAKSTLNRKIMYALQRDGSGDDNWDPYSGEQKIDLTSEYQTFSHTFKMTSDTDPKTILSISMGAVDGRIMTKHTIKIDNITLEETEAQEIPPVEDGTEMIQNGDFSEGDAHWVNAVTEPGAAEVSFADGKAVYKISNVGSEDYHIQLKYEELLTLEKGAEYAVKLKIKSSAARTVKYAFLDPAYKWYGGEDLVLNADELKEVDYTLKVTEDTSDKITFQISMGQIYDHWDESIRKPIPTPISDIEIDDISIKKVSGGSGDDPATPFDGGMIKNGDFSDGDAHWEKSIWGDGAAEVTFTDGKATYKISNVGTEDSQVQLKHKELLTLEKGAEYAVKLKIKSTEARTVKYAFLTPSYDWYGGEDLSLTAGEVKEINYTLKVSKDTNDKITFVISMGKIENEDTPISTIEIDDISVKKTSGGSGDDPATPDDPFDGGMIKNGDFSDGDAYWEKSIWGDGAAEVTFTDGKATFKISNVGTEDSQVQLKHKELLTLEKGAEYAVKLKIKSTEARTVKYAFLTPSYDWYGGEDLSLTAGEVKEVNYTLKVSKDTNDKITFVISMGKIENEDTPISTIEIDDISVKKTSGGSGDDPATPDDPFDGGMIKNGDFSDGDAYWEKSTWGDGAAEVTFTDGKATYKISNVGTEDSQVQLKHKELLKLEKGAEYAVKLKIKSTEARTVKYAFLTPSYDWYGGEDLSLTAGEVKEVNYTLKVSKDTNDKITFAISMGKIENEDTPISTIEIDDISVKKISGDTPKPEDKPLAIGTELIVNGDFGLEEENWEKAITPPGDAEVKFTNGKATYTISNVGDKNSDVQLKQSGLTLEKGATYKVNLKIKSSAARTVKVVLLDSEQEYGSSDIVLNANRQKSISFVRTIPEDLDTSKTVEFIVYMGKIEGKETPESTIEIDDISVKKVKSTTQPDAEVEEPAPDQTNLIQNGDFSEGENHWKADFADIATDKNGPAGNVSFAKEKVRFEIFETGENDDDIYLEQSGLVMREDTKYEVGLKIASTVNGTAKIKIGNDSSNAQEITLKANKLVSFSTTISCNADSDENGNTFCILLGKINDDSSNEPYAVEIDDISIKEVESESEGYRAIGTTISKPEDTEDEKNLIKNGNFARGKANWVNAVTEPGTAEVSLVNGKATYKITNVGTEDWHIQLKHKEELTLEKGAEYAIKLKIKSSAARTVKYAFLGTGNKWYGGEDLVLTADELKEVDYTLKVTEDTSNEITFLISMGQIYDHWDTDIRKPIPTAISTIEIDDISVKKISGGSEPEIPDNLIKEGDFTNTTYWSSTLTGKNADADGNAAVSTQKLNANKARFDIQDVGNDNWCVQLKYAGLEMEKDANYKISFKIASSIDRTVSISLMGPNYKYGGGDNIDLKAGKKISVGRVITLAQAYESGPVEFQINMGKIGNGLDPHAIEISEVSIVKVGEDATSDEDSEENCEIAYEQDSELESTADDNKDTESESEEQEAEKTVSSETEETKETEFSEEQESEETASSETEESEETESSKTEKTEEAESTETEESEETESSETEKSTKTESAETNESET